MYKLTVNGSRQDVGALVFDKDGTLLDMMSMWGTWSSYMHQEFSQRLESQGQSARAADLASLWGLVQEADGAGVGYDRQGPMAMGTMDELYTLLAWGGYKAGLSWAESKRLVYACCQAADEAMERVRPARLIPGAEELLATCRAAGVPMAVVTADETEAALRHLDWLGLTDAFPVVIGTDQAERGKPFPDLLLLACSQLGVPPEQTAVIGDTNGDMMMGLAAGSLVRIALDLTVGSMDTTWRHVDRAVTLDAAMQKRQADVQVDDETAGHPTSPDVFGATDLGGESLTDSGQGVVSFPDATHIIQGYHQLRLGSFVI